MGSTWPPTGSGSGWPPTTNDPGGRPGPWPPAGPPPAYPGGAPAPTWGGSQTTYGGPAPAGAGGWGTPPPGWAPDPVPTSPQGVPLPPPGPLPAVPPTEPLPSAASVADRDRDPLIGGLVLIAIGALLLAGNWVPGVATLIPLAVGIVLLVLFVARRQFGLLVAGCIVSGVGVGVALASRTGGTDAGALVLLSMAGGFASIWLVARLAELPEPAAWSLVPAAILGSIGALLLVGIDGVAIGDWWPLVLVALGVLVIAGGGRRHHLR